MLANDLVVTSGFSDESGELQSYYPRGIPIGAVTYVNQPDNALYKDIRVTPWVDLDAFTSVLVLTQRRGPRQHRRSRRREGRAAARPRRAQPRGRRASATSSWAPC